MITLYQMRQVLTTAEMERFDMVRSLMGSQFVSTDTMDEYEYLVSTARSRLTAQEEE